MTCRGTTLALSLAHVPAARADLAALATFDPNHDGGDAVRLRHVSACPVGASGVVRYRVRMLERGPDGVGGKLDLPGRYPTATAAALDAIRYLKWRHGAGWPPPARGGRPPEVEAFNDELDPLAPASWVGRVWVGGRPVLVFAGRREAGFATRDAAFAAAVGVVGDRFGAGWRRFLGRWPRPWADPVPAALLRPAVAAGVAA